MNRCLRLFNKAKIEIAQKEKFGKRLKVFLPPQTGPDEQRVRAAQPLFQEQLST